MVLYTGTVQNIPTIQLLCPAVRSTSTSERCGTRCTVRIVQYLGYYYYNHIDDEHRHIVSEYGIYAGALELHKQESCDVIVIAFSECVKATIHIFIVTMIIVTQSSFS
jgi:hypothetical protein